MNNISIDELFDEFNFQIEKVGFEKYDKGIRWFGFEKFKPWESKFNYVFDVYSNDHLIDGKPHFHFKHLEKKIDCKINLEGVVLESNGINELDSKMIKMLQKFLIDDGIQTLLYEMWNTKNPSLAIKI